MHDKTAMMKKLSILCSVIQLTCAFIPTGHVPNKIQCQDPTQTSFVIRILILGSLWLIILMKKVLMRVLTV